MVKAHIPRLLPIALVALSAVVGVATRSGLYADGAWFALNIRQSDAGLWVTTPQRWLANVLTQVPSVPAHLSPGTSVRVEASIYAASLVLVPATVWILAFIIAFKSREYWWLVLAWVTSAGISMFFFVGEYNVAYALVGLAASIIMVRNFSIGTFLVLGFVSVVLLFAYETVLFLGPLLATMMVAALRLQEPLGRAARLSGYAIAALFLTSAVIAAISVANPNNTAKLTFGHQLALLDFWPAVVSVLVLCCWAVAMCFPGLSRQISWGVLLLAVLALGLGVGSMIAPSLAVNPWQYYNARLLGGVLLFCSLAAMMWQRWWALDRGACIRQRVATSHALLAVGLTVTLLSTMTGFSEWLGDVEKTVRQGSGPIPYGSTNLDSPFKWDWALPSLSLILQDSSDQGVVLPPESFWNEQPFDPLVDLPVLQSG